MKRTFDFLGVQTFYSIQGSGETVVLLHGFGEDSKIWNNLTPGLSDYQLIIPDLPGSGLSEPLDLSNASMSGYAAFVESILRGENIESVHLIGHSMGGYIAMEFASRYPDKLKSVTLFHSSAFADDAEKIETRRKAIDFIESHGVSAFLKTSIPNLFKEPELHNATIAKLVDDGRSFLTSTLVHYYQAMIGRNDHSGLLSALNIPVLFIIGEFDKAVPLKISLKQSYLPAISYVHILRNSAHMGMCEEPDKISLITNDFLKGIGKG